MKKNIVTNILLPLIAFALVSSCNDGNASQSQTSEVEEGIDIQRNPLEAVQKALELGKNSGNIKPQNSSEAPTEPVSFKKLIEYLPQAPQGWTASNPKGETTSIGSYSISQVSQTYKQKDKQVTVKIFDWAFNSALYTPFLLTTEFSQESTEGYNKGIKIDDTPGREEYTYSSKKGSLNLLVNSRFFVQIEGKEIEDNELREWWQFLDQESLAKISRK